MDDPNRCPACGAGIIAGAPAGLCPICLLRGGMGEPEAGKETPLWPGRPFEPPAPEELARQLPHLEILELLGAGGMGAVYRARQPSLGRTVALKVLPPDASRDPEFAERFVREGRALARLSHPNIVAIHDSGRTPEGLYYFLMEHVDGVDLRQVIAGGHLEPREVLAIISQICDALQYAHDAGVVHRDIKPENILVDRQGRVKIADFGLAKLLAMEPAELTLTRAGQVLGTWHYMAPEQVERGGRVDHRADIYSLGVVFYEMLTGELPLGRFEPPSSRVALDVRLDQVVLRSLERDPERRYQQVREVKGGFESVSQERGERPPAGEDAERELPEQVPRRAGKPLSGVGWRFWWAATGCFAVAWLATAALWNLGPLGLAIGTLVTACVAAGLARAAIRRSPTVLGAWQHESRGRQVAAVATSTLGFLGGLGALMLVTWGNWEGTIEEQPTARAEDRVERIDVFPALHRGQEHELLRDLDAYSGDGSRVRLAHGYTGHFRLPSSDLPIPYFAVMAGLLLWLAAAQLLAPRWPGWAAAGRLLLPAALVATPVFAGWIAANHVMPADVRGLFFVATHREPVGQSLLLGAVPPERALASIEEWSRTKGYVKAEEGRWSLKAVPGDSTVATVRVLVLAPRSIFERWGSTRHGMALRGPTLSVRLVSSLEPVESTVTVRAGMARVEKGEAELWRTLVGSLAQALETADIE